jgi:shikimate dehydrogenase
MVDAKTKLICILGHPVGHSKSPIMHNAILQEQNINANYMAFDVEPKDLGEAVTGLRKLNFLGANITIPHKEAVIEYVDELTEEAKNIGAVNTLFTKDGKLYGDNTDGRGFIISLMKDGGFDPKGKTVLILGAGGASKAVSSKLVLEGIAKMYLSDLDKKKANDLKEHLNKLDSNIEVELVESAQLDIVAGKSNLIVNCTPVGMKESDPLLVSESSLNESQFVFDLIYNPAKTKLIKKAEEKGAKTLNGLGMLIYQGALSFEKWTLQKPDTKKMFEIVKGEK